MTVSDNFNDESASCTPIHDFLSDYADRRCVRCHMPGHKGVENQYDITEIDGADSLYESDLSDGIISKSERAAARLFAAEKTLYSCGGSTLAIQTMLALAKAKSPNRDHVVAGRYSHRSFISSCIHLGLTPSWVYPDKFLSADISPFEIEKHINDRTMAVFVNSIDYYGGMCDISAVSDVCRARGIPLLVDNAHGAYLAFTKEKNHPIRMGADMCCDSAHKTLPVLTGGAYLHIANNRYSAQAKEMMSVFGSSSPSYLVLDSLDRCNEELIGRPRHTEQLCCKIDELKSCIAGRGFVLSKSDRLRITLDCFAMNTTGTCVAQALKEFGIECEYADSCKCVLLFGWSTSDADIQTVKEVFGAFTPAQFVQSTLPAIPSHIKTAAVCSAAKAFYGMRLRCDIRTAVNRTCAQIVAPCPPGIPLIMPGELITDQAVAALRLHGVKSIEVAL